MTRLTLPQTDNTGWTDKLNRAIAEGGGAIRVASSEATQAQKDAAWRVCTGTNDQTEINLALLDARRVAEGGLGTGVVELVGGTFYVGQNGGSIQMQEATWLRGAGPGMLIEPRFASDVDKGAIELASNTVAHVTVSNVGIGRPSSILANGHGIKFVQSGAGSSSVTTGNDPFISIRNVTVGKMSRAGFYLTGTSGGCRETQMFDCHTWDTRGHGFWIDSSDSKFTHCTSQPGADGAHGFQIGGGNTKIAQCKSYYSEGDADGFNVTSSRAEVHACAAQDSGRYGFYFAGQDVTATGCVADSNARITASGGGFYIGADGNYSALTAFDRAQTPASPQLKAIVFGGSPQVFLTGRTKVPSGSAHVTGSPGANSYARVVRDGTTLYTVG